MVINFGGFFLILFLVLKLGGPLAAWHWLWIFLPIVPVLVFAGERLGAF